MNKNRTATDDIIVTDNGLKSFKSFATLSNTLLLHRGLHMMFIMALKKDLCSEVWFEEFLEEYKILVEFIEEVAEEYGPE